MFLVAMTAYRTAGTQRVGERHLSVRSNANDTKGEQHSFQRLFLQLFFFGCKKSLDIKGTSACSCSSTPSTPEAKPALLLEISERKLFHPLHLNRSAARRPNNQTPNWDQINACTHTCERARAGVHVQNKCPTGASLGVLTLSRLLAELPIWSSPRPSFGTSMGGVFTSGSVKIHGHQRRCIMPRHLDQDESNRLRESNVDA